jgi:hypothetical protein
VCFIDIEEKYKTMIIGDHRQEKKRNRKTNSSGWIRTSTRVTALTILTDQLDWDINMAGHYTQTTTEKTRAKPQLHPQTALM